MASSVQITFGLPPEDVQAALGRLAIRHGQLEYAFKMMVKSLLRFDIKDALKYTKRKHASQIRKEILQTAKKKLRDKAALKELERFIDKAWELSEKRNRLLHDLWGESVDTREYFHQQEDLTWSSPLAKDIDVIAAETIKLANELTESRLYGTIAGALQIMVQVPPQQQCWLLRKIAALRSQ